MRDSLPERVYGELRNSRKGIRIRTECLSRSGSLPDFQSPQKTQKRIIWNSGTLERTSGTIPPPLQHPRFQSAFPGPGSIPDFLSVRLSLRSVPHKLRSCRFALVFCNTPSEVRNRNLCVPSVHSRLLMPHLLPVWLSVAQRVRPHVSIAFTSPLGEYA